jgi:hypothetical protein
MQEHQQQPQQQQHHQDLAQSFARTFSTFRRHPDSVVRRMSSVERPSMPSSSYMTLSSTSTISTSVSIHGGLSSTAPRFQQRQSRLPDQPQHQPLPQQLPQQQQPPQQSLRRRPRPLSADMSLARAPFNSYGNSNHNYPASMSTSKSEFFRVVRNRLMEEFEGSDDNRHLSSESLLADSSSVSMESSLDYFVNKDHSNIEEDDDEDIETPTPTTPNASSHCRKGVSSLDSLLDNETSGAGMSIQNQQLTMSSRAKSNSLPKSAFGSLQLKVQEIRAQLDVLKTSSDVRRVLQQVCPPPRPQGQENTQHPNTPAHGFEYMMPPNVVKEQNGSSGSTWASFFPVFPTSAIDGSACSGNPDRRPVYPAVHAQQQQQSSSMFQSPPSSSQDTDSVSPLSMSPSRTSSPATAQQAATLSLSIAPSNNSAAALAMMGTSGSSSPSTLSASSSNSLPTSVSRPSVLKIPQSQSLNSFPYNGINDNNNNNNNNCNNNLKKYFDDDAAVSQVGRLFFFYDVLSTQEKISKVRQK